MKRLNFTIGAFALLTAFAAYSTTLAPGSAPADTDNATLLLQHEAVSLWNIEHSAGGTCVNLSTTTSATGATWVNLGDQLCTKVTVYNLTGTTLSFRRGGAGVSIEVPDGIAKAFGQITNANQLSVQRFDQADSSAVTFKAEAVTP